jgi:hypothetical protein
LELRLLRNRLTFSTCPAIQLVSLAVTSSVLRGWTSGPQRQRPRSAPAVLFLQRPAPSLCGGGPPSLALSGACQRYSRGLEQASGC